MIALFPGQGSQSVGMTKTLYENFSIAKQTFEEASDSIQINLKKLCFEGPESELVLTENTQPCLLTASIAAFRVAESEFEFKPKAAAGHSLGEYSALVAAGAIPLSTAVSWVKERGKAMQEAVPNGQGSMAAVMGLEDDMIQKLCTRATQEAESKRKSSETSFSVPALVEPANYNTFGQTVISGSADAIQEAVNLISSEDFSGGKIIPLSVSAPFHSKLMKPAREKMAQIFARTPEDQKPKSLNCPYLPNRTARITQEASLVLELLVEQIDHPVLWKQTLLTFIEHGYLKGVEFGPGKVLQGLAKRTARAKKVDFPVLSFGEADGMNDLEKFLGRVAQ